jgi:Fic family protein
MDVTGWLLWFFGVLRRAINLAQGELDTVFAKAHFWRQWGATSLNERQIKLLNRLLDGFEGNLTSGKWAKIARCSQDTALRDITDLLSRGVLRKGEGGGRSTSYVLNQTTPERA